jgi:hypothetical protein
VVTKLHDFLSDATNGVKKGGEDHGGADLDSKPDHECQQIPSHSRHETQSFLQQRYLLDLPVPAHELRLDLLHHHEGISLLQPING